MKRILLVDDSKTIQRLLNRVLSPHFLIVGLAGNGFEGFELYKQLKPDVVILDIVMPNCNGQDCLKSIIDFDPQAKVIMASSLGDEATVNECLAIGAKAFVNKNQISHEQLEDSPILKIVQNELRELNPKVAA